MAKNWIAVENAYLGNQLGYVYATVDEHCGSWILEIPEVDGDVLVSNEEKEKLFGPEWESGWIPSEYKVPVQAKKPWLVWHDEDEAVKLGYVYATVEESGDAEYPWALGLELERNWPNRDQTRALNIFRWNQGRQQKMILISNEDKEKLFGPYWDWGWVPSQPVVEMSQAALKAGRKFGF